LIITVISTNGFYPLTPTPLEQKWFQTGLKYKHFVYRNLKSENSQNYMHRNLKEIVCSFVHEFGFSAKLPFSDNFWNQLGNRVGEGENGGCSKPNYFQYVYFCLNMTNTLMTRSAMACGETWKKKLSLKSGL